MLKYSEFIKESNEDKNLVVGGVEFSITNQELDYALFEITDVFPELNTYTENSKYSDIIEHNKDVFIIILECTNISGDIFSSSLKVLHYIEPKIFECIKYFQDKMNYYGLDVLYSDFGENDQFYEIIIGKKGTKIDLKEKYRNPGRY